MFFQPPTNPIQRFLQKQSSRASSSSSSSSSSPRNQHTPRGGENTPVNGNGTCLRWIPFVLVFVYSFLFIGISDVILDSTLKSSSSLSPHNVMVKRDRSLIHHGEPIDIGIDIDIETTHQPKPPPAVAWLMSYPNSGTSFTITMTFTDSNTTVAVNYPKETHNRGERVEALYSNSTLPVLLTPDLDLPSQYILTKTHCGGTCAECGPKKYGETFHSFMTKCASNRGRDPYDLTLVKKAIHIIRDPIDNAVSNFRLKVKQKTLANATKWLSHFSNDADGFVRWCKAMDHWYLNEETKLLSPNVTKQFDGVLCHGTFYKYIKWHDLALEVTDTLKLPTLIVRYEDYSRNFEEQKEKIFEFLHLSDKGNKVQFLDGKSYGDYVPWEDRQKIFAMMEKVASPAAWELIKPYYEGNHSFMEKVREMDTDQIETKSVKSEILHANSRQEVESLHKNKAEQPGIAWLLSFPNSGTTYTLRLASKDSGTTIAGNYPSEIKGRRQGLYANFTLPVLFSPDLPLPEKYVLTKSHCGGYGAESGPRAYKQNLDSFMVQCASARGEDPYDVNLVKKAIHLIRHPIDNAVSNYHHQFKVKTEGGENDWVSSYSNDVKGFRKWCKMLDKKWAKDERKYLPEETYQHFARIPCHGLFNKYLLWHNLAHETIEKLGIPSHILYYEDYASKFDTTKRGLFEFLDLKDLGNSVSFEPGKSYEEYFTPREHKQIFVMIKNLSSSTSWKSLMRYAR